MTVVVGLVCLKSDPLRTSLILIKVNGLLMAIDFLLVGSK